MHLRDEVIEHLDRIYESQLVQDYGPNGLQVEGRADVQRIATGVTASLEFLTAARDFGADLAIVHHGIFWNGASPVLRGSLGKRVRLLLESGMTLLAYHLPMDRHAEVGNNAPALRAWGVTDLLPFAVAKGVSVGWRGRFETPLPVDDVVARIRKYYDAEPLSFLHGPPVVRTIGLVSGAAQGEIHAAIAAKLDLFVTGEVSEYNLHLAKEEGIHHLSVGHHASERVGPRALAAYCARTFGIPAAFLDFPNPA